MNKTIKVRVIPKSSKNSVEDFAGGLKVHLTTAPAKGKANKALVETLAKHFKIKKSHISIMSGTKSKNKIIKFVQPKHGLHFKPGTWFTLSPA